MIESWYTEKKVKSHVFTFRHHVMSCVYTWDSSVTCLRFDMMFYHSRVISCDLTLGPPSAKERTHIYAQIMAHIILSHVPRIDPLHHLRATKCLGAAKQMNHDTHINTNHDTYMIESCAPHSRAILLACHQPQRSGGTNESWHIYTKNK